MSKIITTKKLGSHVISQLVESITEPANNVYYITTSKHIPYANGDVVVEPYDRVKDSETDYYQQLIFGKKINSDDVIHMAPRYNWTTGTVYDSYSDTDSNLFSKKFYVVSNQGSKYYVYKVLDNNNRSPSTVDPGSADTEASTPNFVTTSDGYTWKLMYEISQAQFEKFATDNYMPVIKNEDVAANNVSGAIDIIKIVSPGSNYVATYSNTFVSTDIRDAIPGGNNTTYKLTSSASSNNDFYVGSGINLTVGTGAGQIRKIISYAGATRIITIDKPFTTSPAQDTQYTISPLIQVFGDATSNAIGIASVASGNGVNNYISSITLVSRGAGYTYASAIVTGNTGGVSNSAVLNVVLPPVGNHGYDPVNELGANYLGISVDFSLIDNEYLTTDNDFRQIAILKDPLFNNVHVEMEDDIGTFVPGENVYQVSYKTLTGTVTCDASDTTITGIDTDFNESVSIGDKVIITDTINNIRFLRTVGGVVNATSLTLTSNSAFNIDTFGKIAVTSIDARGVKTGNSTPYITLGSVEPKFKPGKRIIGESSGSWANIKSIEVNEKTYNNWNTFDARTRINYSAVTGDFDEDDEVYQIAPNVPILPSAYYHSANTTHVFLTSEKGPVNADPNEHLQSANGAGEYVLGSIKYTPDIQKGSGQVLYIENMDTPVSRAPNQSEKINIVLKF